MAYDPGLGYDPNDPSTYSGVPNDNIQYGKIIRTGTLNGQPSRVEDYGGTPVYLVSGGSIRLMQHGETVPAGATISLGIPPTTAMDAVSAAA